MDRMRSFNEHVEPDDAYDAVEDAADASPPPSIGQDERRMHVRAYNFWAKLLENRSFPAAEDLDLNNLGEFGPHAVLLDFTSGIENPAIVHVGDAIRAESGISVEVDHIADVPRRSLLSRLTDHYLQIIANRAPIGFEAEFQNEAGATIMYRGVLLPFSSDDDTIDFMLGVLNWKQAADRDLSDDLAREVAAAAAALPMRRPTAPVWADGPESDSALGDDQVRLELDNGTVPHAPAAVADFDLPLTQDASDGGLADLLAAARDSADEALATDARGHRALYRAMARAWGFAQAVNSDPETYAELLDSAGVKAQPRAPMTPIIKLVFGAAHDKTRIAEYATVLRHAEREHLSPADLEQRLLNGPGGLKGLVSRERAALRQDKPVVDKLAMARDILRNAPAFATIDVGAMDDEFVVFVARRNPDGSTAIVAASEEPMTARLLPQFLRS